jgi:hypothetical protein
MKPVRIRNPGLLMLLALAVLATSAVQAAGPVGSQDSNSGVIFGDDGLWKSLRGFDLVQKIRDWKPKVNAGSDGEGFNLAHPFGKSGPGLQFTSSLPDSVVHSMAAGGSQGINRPVTDAYIFLQKRW